MKIASHGRFFAAVILSAVVLALSGCGKYSPEKVVKRELDLIKQLDEDTITSFISYEDMMSSNSTGSDAGDETTEAVKLFFKHFNYKITSATSTENTATVSVTITNIDTQALAKDVCLALVKLSASQETRNPLNMNSYFALLGNTLSAYEYDLVKRDCEIELTNTDKGWVIQNTAKLEDNLVSGFITYLNDPYLISPEEMIAVVCEGLKEKTPEEWEDYLDMEDIFSTGSQYYEDVDFALASQLSRFYSYEITSVTENKEQNRASASVNITSLDMNAILREYHERLLAYAATTESIRADDYELADHTAKLLTEVLNANTATVTTSVDIDFTNNGSTWEIQLDEHFTSALIGNMREAIEAFQNL